MAVAELDLPLPGGGSLHAYDTGPVDASATVLWHHGTPNVGMPPAPLAHPGVRWLSFDRPGYGGSTPAPGRDVVSTALAARVLVEALDVPRLGVMGHSGGGPHALASAAIMPDRVAAVALVASLAPHDSPGLDYYAGMAASGEATLRAAHRGRAARVTHEIEHGDSYDPEFTAADLRTLRGPWSWLESVVGPAVADGPDAAIDDDVAYATPWGFALDEVTAPVLLLHGDADRVVPSAHSSWLASRLDAAELRIEPGAGHLSVLDHADDALTWLVDRLSA